MNLLWDVSKPMKAHWNPPEAFQGTGSPRDKLVANGFEVISGKMSARELQLLLLPEKHSEQLFLKLSNKLGEHNYRSKFSEFTQVKLR